MLCPHDIPRLPQRALLGLIKCVMCESVVSTCHNRVSHVFPWVPGSAYCARVLPIRGNSGCRQVIVCLGVGKCVVCDMCVNGRHLRFSERA